MIEMSAKYNKVHFFHLFITLVKLFNNLLEIFNYCDPSFNTFVIFSCVKKIYKGEKTI